MKISQIFEHLHWNISMHILPEFAVNRLRKRVLRGFFELELILFFLRRHEFTRLRDINTKLLRHLFDPDDDNQGPLSKVTRFSIVNKKLPKIVALRASA